MVETKFIAKTKSSEVILWSVKFEAHVLEDLFGFVAGDIRVHVCDI